MRDKRFTVYGCHGCWKLNSAYQPTVIAGVRHRPVAHERTRVAVCYFCGVTAAGVHRWDPTP